MKRTLSTILTLIALHFSYPLYAEEEVKDITFEKTSETKTEDLIIPFKLNMFPTGYLDHGVIYINLNSSAEYANINIYKNNILVEYATILIRNSDEMATFNLASHGNGNFQIYISFYNSDTYTATEIIQ